MTIEQQLRATARRLYSTPFPGVPLVFTVMLLLGGGGYLLTRFVRCPSTSHDLSKHPNVR